MPYNRLLRWELFRSDRFLSLPSDTHRIVFVALVTEADDFGNFEGGSRRLWRWMASFSQVKLEQDAIKLLSDLQDADLTRRYEVDGKEYWHIPRFKNQRTYWNRIQPKSPWCASDRTGPVKKAISDSDLNQIVVRPDSDLNNGVGVGVGVGVNLKNKTTPQKRLEPIVLPDWIPIDQWNAWIESRKKSKKAPTNWALRLAIAKLDDLRQKGHHPKGVLAQSAFNSWAGLFPIKETT